MLACLEPQPGRNLGAYTRFLDPMAAPPSQVQYDILCYNNINHLEEKVAHGYKQISIN